ncbi:MAG: acyl-CoA synthetase [Actinomycetota bacterium]
MTTYNLADLFESVVDSVPERTAVVCGDARRTYAELDARANRLAHHLQSAGIRPGEHIGMYLQNGIEYIEALVACLKVRAVPINVNFRYVEEELRYLLDDADIVALLHGRQFAPRLEAIRADLPLVRHLIAVEDGSDADVSGLGSVAFEDVVGAASADRDFPARSSDDRFIIYTGGTTGFPKGVVWRQEDFFFTCLGGGNPQMEPISSPEQLGPNAKARDPQIVQFVMAPLIHGAGQLGLFIGLNWGDKVVVAPRFDPEGIWRTIGQERVNTMFVVGDAMARPLVEHLAQNADAYDLTSLVYVGSSGALLSTSIKDQLRSLLPNVFIGENFGSTETGNQGMEAQDVPKPETGLRFRMNDRSAVFDDDMKRVKAGSGVVGKLALTGRIPLLYHKDPEKTERTFVHVEGKRWVMPGDLATVDADGTIIVFGRGAVCINSGGEKIYPEEVEMALKAHPAVYDAVVVGVPDERWGERVAAVVQMRPGAALTLDEMTEHARTKVAGYKVPRELHLVDEVRRQPSGKPDYPWAKQIAIERSERTS